MIDSRNHGAPAKKQLGQHFLHDPAVLARIVRAIQPQPDQTLVEIGPGRGALTQVVLRALLETANVHFDAEHPALTVIEFDRDLIPGLQGISAELAPLRIIHDDVLEVDLSALAGHQPIRLFGNLPYNISSPILFHALAHADAISDMHFMLQKEVVERMVAPPGDKTYGRLSVMVQAYARAELLFRVGPGAFRPPPKVDSAVVRLLPYPRKAIGINDPALFARLVKAAFAQRRKTLRNALQEVCTPDQMLAVGIDPGDRAERIPVAQFIALANAIGA